MISGFQNNHFSKIICFLLIIFIIFNSAGLSYARISSSICGSVIDSERKIGIKDCRVLVYDIKEDNVVQYILTDANGNYYVENIFSGNYRINVSLPLPYKQESISKEIVIDEGSNISNITFFAETGGGISGIVYHADSTTAFEGAIIKAISPSGGISFSETNKSGEYIVEGLAPNDSCKISVSVKGSTSIVKENIVVIKDKITPHINFVFSQTQGFSLSGKIITNTDIDISKAVCLIIPKGSSEIYGYTEADGYGNFNITGITNGEYQLITFLKSGEIKQTPINIYSDISGFEVSFGNNALRNYNASSGSGLEWAKCMFNCLVFGETGKLCRYAIYTALGTCTACFYAGVFIKPCVDCILGAAGVAVCAGICIGKCKDDFPCTGP